MSFTPRARAGAHPALPDDLYAALDGAHTLITAGRLLLEIAVLDFGEQSHLEHLERMSRVRPLRDVIHSALADLIRAAVPDSSERFEASCAHEAAVALFDAVWVAAAEVYAGDYEGWRASLRGNPRYNALLTPTLAAECVKEAYRANAARPATKPLSDARSVVLVALAERFRTAPATVSWEGVRRILSSAGFSVAMEPRKSLLDPRPNPMDAVMNSLHAEGAVEPILKSPKPGRTFHEGQGAPDAWRILPKILELATALTVEVGVAGQRKSAHSEPTQETPSAQGPLANTGTSGAVEPIQLDRTERDILLTLLRLNATAQTRKTTRGKVAQEINRLWDETNVARQFQRLRESTYTEGTVGPHGGVWLTIAGRARAEAVRDEEGQS